MAARIFIAHATIIPDELHQFVKTLTVGCPPGQGVTRHACSRRGGRHEQEDDQEAGEGDRDPQE